MDERRDKGLILFRQERYDLAERELRAMLADWPDDAWAHALLAHCLKARGRLDDAEASARASVAADPESDFAHKTLAVVLANRGRLGEARDAVREAIRLDPHDASHRAYLAAIELDAGDPALALREADAAVALDPNHVISLNVRGKALVALGHAGEATQALTRSLEVDPSNGDTHEAMGAALLAGGQADAAAERYREALRLDPESGEARAGYVRALKARHRLYRSLLTFVLWTGQQRTGIRGTVLLAVLAVMNLIRFATGRMADLMPLAVPIAIALFALFTLTWLADPLFNLLVRLNPTGRHALTPAQRARSNYALALVALAVCFGMTLLVESLPGAAVWLVVAGFVALPASLTAGYPPGRQRKLLAIHTAAAAGVGGLAWLAYGTGQGMTASALFVAYMVACAVSPLVRARGAGEAGV